MTKIERRVGEVIRALTELGGEATVTELRRYVAKKYSLGSARLYQLIKEGLTEGLLIRRLTDTERGPRAVITLSERHPGISKQIKFWRERFIETENFALKGEIINEEQKEHYKRLLKNELNFLLGTMCYELWNAVMNAWLKAGEDREARLRQARILLEELFEGIILPISGSVINIASTRPDMALEILMKAGDELHERTKLKESQAVGQIDPSKDQDR